MGKVFSIVFWFIVVKLAYMVLSATSTLPYV